MNILVRADSSSSIGTGHIMRDLVLVQQYSNAHIIFVSQNLKGNISDKVLGAGYEYITLESNNVKELCTIIQNKKIDLLIIDHYDINLQFEKFIKKNTKVKILSFDDTYEKHYCDILLNPNFYSHPSQYKKLVPNHCEIRCGKKHILLREEFYQEKNKGRQNNNNNTFTIFIAIGGTDHTNINPQILTVLEEFKHLNIVLVTTTANKHLQELKSFVENKTPIQLHINSTNIAQLMNKADLAIISPSVTMNEILFLKIPFIAIKTANNQNYMVEYLQTQNSSILNLFNSSNFFKKLSQKILY